MSYIIVNDRRAEEVQRLRSLAQAYIESHFQEKLSSWAETKDGIRGAKLLNIDSDVELGNALSTSPFEMLQIFSEVGTAALNSLKCSGKVSISILNYPQMSTFKSSELYLHTEERLTAFSGSVVRVRRGKILEFGKKYSCSRCSSSWTIQLRSPQPNGALPKRIKNCPNGCVRGALSPIEGTAEHLDYQEITVQILGSKEEYLTVILLSHLFGSLCPGERAVITGIPYLRWGRTLVGNPFNTEIWFLANNIQRMRVEESESSIGVGTDFFFNYWTNRNLITRDSIVRSFCPSLFALYPIKLGILVVLAGGRKKFSGELSRRGLSHLLLVGDPGTGKSQLITAILDLCPDGIRVYGSGTSSVGLTACAVKENTSWTLEAGALVLAHNSVCCIDELTHLRPADLLSLHDAMEHGEVRITKAGLNQCLKSGCSVIGACNPKFNKDERQKKSGEDIGLEPPLLSRFDLIFRLDDIKDQEWDFRMATALLGLSGEEEESAPWTTSRLRDYLRVIKTLEPILDGEPERLLKEYYNAQRGVSKSGFSTHRLYESLCRLAEGHARLMYRTNVELEDAVNAIYLFEVSIKNIGLLGNTIASQTEFPPNPIIYYNEIEGTIFSKLNFSHQSLDIGMELDDEFDSLFSTLQ